MFGDTDLRRTHPMLFRGIVTIGLICMGLGLNFIFANPTFNPYGIDKEITGGIFLGLGVMKLLLVLVFKNLLLLRINMALCMMYMLFWGIGTSITYFTGQTSLQLFVLYTGLTAMQLFFLNEPPMNPLTASKKLKE